MPGLTIHQRCWNHEAREAVCQCPGCARGFCRECVTEHEARLLCAACLRDVARSAQPRRGAVRRLVPAALFFGGMVLAWLVFFGAGAALNLFAERMEQSSWQTR